MPFIGNSSREAFSKYRRVQAVLESERGPQAGAPSVKSSVDQRLSLVFSEAAHIPLKAIPRLSVIILFLKH